VLVRLVIQLVSFGPSNTSSQTRLVAGLPGLEPGTSSLSEIYGWALCYPAFPLVRLLRKSHKDGANRDPSAAVLATGLEQFVSHDHGQVRFCGSRDLNPRPSDDEVLALTSEGFRPPKTSVISRLSMPAVAT
jgi:hypothetical protein